MTKKDYEAIAKIMKTAGANARLDAGHNGGSETWICIRNRLADHFVQDNPNFDHDKFILACEP